MHMPRDVASCIRAVVRVRPLLPHETARGEKSCCEVRDANTVLVQQAGQQWRQYSFDACLSSERTQKQVFQECGVTSLLDSAMVGYSATVLAYGQTGSGKTHSIIGRLGSSNADDSKRDDGLIMRSAKRLFRNISSGGAAGETYTVSASFVEIFNAPGAVNECICDLLNSEAGNLQVRYSQSHGFFVSELCVVDCHSAADVRSVLEAGVQTRRVCAHNLNKDSSRSHALFTLYIKSTTPAPEEGGQPLKRFGKITFVDLAGSERLKESCAEGNARKETQAINKSLFTLGQVISLLAQGKSKKHVPYRNSKLTQLLQESFGGEALCLMVTCISPAGGFAEESLNSLNYAQKAMNIRNRPVVRLDEKQQLLHDLKTENAALRKELECYRMKYGPLSPRSLELGVTGQCQPGLAGDMMTELRLPASVGHATAAAGALSSSQAEEVHCTTFAASQVMDVDVRHLQPSVLEGAAETRTHQEARALSPIPDAMIAAPEQSYEDPPRMDYYPPEKPPAAPTQQPPVPKAVGGSGAARGGYAQAMIKRKMLSEQPQNARRKQTSRSGTSLPPLPGRSPSHSAAGSSEAPAGRRTPMSRCSSGGGSGGAAVAAATAATTAAAPSPGALDADDAMHAQAVASMPVARGRATPEFVAPPSQKVSTLHYQQLRRSSSQEIIPHLTQSQLERLDAAPPSDWNFDFDGARNANRNVASPAARAPGGATGSRRAASAGGAVCGGNSQASSALGHSRGRSHCSSRMSRSKASSGGLSSGSSSTSRSGSSRSRSPGRTSSRKLRRSSMSAKEGVRVHKKGSIVSESTASGTPRRQPAASAGTSPGDVERSSDGNAAPGFQKLSLHELQSQLTSMELATSALMQDKGIAST